MSNIFKGSPPAGEAASSRSTSPGRRAPRFRSDSEFERAAAPIVAEAAPPPPDPLDTLPPVPALARTVASALVISDQPPLAGGIRSLLEELGYRVEVIAGPERPWHHAAERAEPVIVVDVLHSATPEGNGLDLSRIIAVRPLGAGPDFDVHAERLGLRAVLGRRHAIEELKAVIGDPDSTVPDTAETLHCLTDEEIDLALGAADDTVQPAIAPGRRIDERFLLLDPLSPAPQERWRAFDERRLVDVELELRTAPPSDENTTRFLDAARRAQRLHHPNIAELVEAGTWNGLLYTVTERVPGRTLRQRMDSVPGPLPMPAVARIGRQIASALDLAHRRGLAHRGLSPRRVRVADGDRIWLTDLAGFRSPDAVLNTTSDRMMLTEAGYLAPERFSGHGGRGYSSDAWALGVLLYEMSAGFPPFQAHGIEGMRDAVLAASPPPLTAANSAVPEGLAAVVTSLLAADPAERPTDLRKIAERLFAVEASGQRLAWTPAADA
jgi:serine/threonine protein kinase